MKQPHLIQRLIKPELMREYYILHGNSSKAWQASKLILEVVRKLNVLSELNLN